MVKLPEHCYYKYKKLFIFPTLVIYFPISGSKSQVIAPEIGKLKANKIYQLPHKDLTSGTHGGNFCRENLGVDIHGGGDNFELHFSILLVTLKGHKFTWSR